MAEKLLSDRQCATSKIDPGTKEKILADGGNLFLRVRPESKTWLFRYRFGTSQPKLTFGTYPDTSLAEAREKAREARNLLQQGIDPKQHREDQQRKREAEQIAEQQRTMTVRDLFKTWLDAEASRRKDGGVDVQRTFNKDILTEIGEIPLAQVRRKDITALLDKVASRGVKRLCGLLLADMRQMFEFGVIRELLPGNPTTGLKKASWIGQSIERDRVLSDAELIELFQKLPECTMHDSTKHALMIQLSTCTRIGEVAQALWTDVDLDNGIWTIPVENSKNKKSHTVNLSAFALKHLHALKTWKEGLDDDNPKKASPYVIPSHNRNSPRGHICLNTFAKQITDRQRGERAIMSKRCKDGEALALPGGRWVPHDLRRTGATIMGGLGIRPDVIEKCLNHTEQNRIVRIYQRQELRPEMKAAWEALGAHLASLEEKARG